MFSTRIIALLLLTLAVGFGVSCSGKQESPAQTNAGPTWKPTGEEGNIAGAINFTGAVPAPRKIEMSNDSNCEKSGEQFFDDVAVSNGKLQNVFVYVKSGLPQVNFETPTSEVTLDQKACKYVPRILGIQTGQSLKIVNSDDTNHNIHPTPKLNREWNESQLKGQGPITKKFAKQEALIPVKCNMHSWMLAYVGVMSHPFFAVSGADGTFSIKGLPPGEYEIEAWHEKFGAKTTKIKVEAKTTANTDFSFDGTTAYNAGSLKMQPALVLP